MYFYSWLKSREYCDCDPKGAITLTGEGVGSEWPISGRSGHAWQQASAHPALMPWISAILLPILDRVLFGAITECEEPWVTVDPSLTTEAQISTATMLAFYHLR